MYRNKMTTSKNKHLVQTKLSVCAPSANITGKTVFCKTSYRQNQAQQSPESSKKNDYDKGEKQLNNVQQHASKQRKVHHTAERHQRKQI